MRYTVQDMSPAEEYELEMVVRLKEERKIAQKRLFSKVIKLIVIFSIAILSYCNSNYLCGTGLDRDLGSFFTNTMGIESPDFLISIADLIIVGICTSCLFYAMYLLGIFHFLGSIGNNGSGNTRLSNIEGTLRYRNSLVSAMSYEKGADLLIKTSGLDAIASGKFKGSNIEGTTRYVNAIMGAKSYEDGLKMFTDKKK